MKKIPGFIAEARTASETDFLTGANYTKRLIEIIESQRAALEAVLKQEGWQGCKISSEIARHALDMEVDG